MSENPFLSRERFPRFDELTPEAAREALPALIAGTEEKVAALEKACEPTWDGRVAALTDALEPFSRAWHLVGHMLGVRNSDAWRAVEEELQPAVDVAVDILRSFVLAGIDVTMNQYNRLGRGNVKNQ